MSMCLLPFILDADLFLAGAFVASGLFGCSRRGTTKLLAPSLSIVTPAAAWISQRYVEHGVPSIRSGAIETIGFLNLSPIFLRWC